MSLGSHSEGSVVGSVASSSTRARARRRWLWPVSGRGGGRSAPRRAEAQAGGAWSAATRAGAAAAAAGSSAAGTRARGAAPAQCEREVGQLLVGGAGSGVCARRRQQGCERRKAKRGSSGSAAGSGQRGTRSIEASMPRRAGSLTAWGRRRSRRRAGPAAWRLRRHTTHRRHPCAAPGSGPPHPPGRSRFP